VLLLENLDQNTKVISVQHIIEAAENLKGVVTHTPLQFNTQLSDEYGCNIYLKREDLQIVRSFKLRGAYNKIFSLSNSEKKQGLVCASAGNHAQGVAYACRKLNIKGIIYMPKTTPAQKINQVKLFGKEFVEVVLIGDLYDDAYKAAIEFCTKNNSIFVHPFNDEKVIEGQGTVAKEILDDADFKIDYLLVPIGGGGLAAGVVSYFSQLSKDTQIIGVEPEGAPSMAVSIKNGYNTELAEIDKFVDGASVKKVGDKTFEICKDKLSEIVLVPEGRVCTTILNLYNREGIVVEPAGALTIAALSLYDKDKLKGKNVVCVVSGSNNDIMRTEEIKERSLFYEGLKHYFMIQFPQRPGALKEFVTDILDPTDDITYFQFSKKNNREIAPAVVAIEVAKRNDIQRIKDRLTKNKFVFEYLNDNKALYTQLIG
jgi:threonine dehydratase